MTATACSVFHSAAPDATLVHVLTFLARPSNLATIASVSRHVAAFLGEANDTSSSGSLLWRGAFCHCFWSPAWEGRLAAVALPGDFSWRMECTKRLRLMFQHRVAVDQLALARKPWLLAKRDWVKEITLADDTRAFAYTAHLALDVRRAYGTADVSEAEDTVAVIHARPSLCGPNESIHSPLGGNALESQWRSRLTAGRRLRYYEIEVLNTGSKGFIACGAVRADQTRQLRQDGGQPGWGAERLPRSVGYHGDDGRFYPGPQDTMENFGGRAFGPRFSMPGGSPDAGMGPDFFGTPAIEQPPVGAVLTKEQRAAIEGASNRNNRVCGMGMDLDENCFFFTVDGALVDEVKIEGVLVAHFVPAVGMHSPGELVRINLGVAPFWFPIESYSVEKASVPRWENPSQWAEHDESVALMGFV